MCICTHTTLQALSKTFPIAEVVRDTEVSDLWLNDKMQRIPAWHALRGIARQIEQLGIAKPMEKSLAPATAFLRRCKPNERRALTDAGPRVHISSPVGPETVVKVFEDEFDPSDTLIVHHHLDRGSTHFAAVMFAGDSRGGNLASAATAGKIHDVWNSVKNSLKKCGRGRGWAQLVMYSSVNNMPYNPFKTGRWGKQLQQLHREMVNEMEMGVGFDLDAAIELQLEVSPWLAHRSRHDWQTRFATLPFALTALEVLKFARWQSISSCWGQNRDDLYLIKPILERMAPKAGASDPTSESTAFVDSTIASEQHGTDDKTSPLLGRAPGYITPELFRCLDAFVLVAGPARQFHAHSLIEIKSLAEAQKQRMHEALFSFSHLITETFRTLKLSKDSVGLIGVDVKDRSDNAAYLLELAVTVARELGMRLWTSSMTFPGNAAFVHGDEASITKMLEQCAWHWEAILEWENLMLDGDLAASRVIFDITYLHQVLLRMFYEACLHSRHDRRYREHAIWIGTAASATFHDEKLPEDLHNYGRDLARAGRSSRATRKALHNACIQSGVPEARKTNPVTASNAEVA